VRALITLLVNAVETQTLSACSRNPQGKLLLPGRLVWSNQVLVSSPFITDIRSRRIRSLEAHVADIRHTQTTISNTLSELVSHLRAGSFVVRSPSIYPPTFHHQSPSMSSPSLSTPTTSHPHINEMHPSPPGGSNTFPVTHGQVTAPSRPLRATIPITTYQGSSISHSYATNTQNYGHASAQSHILPPFSSITTMGPPSQQGNISSLRYQAVDNSRPLSRNVQLGSKRQAPSSSNVTSADSSDLDEEDNGELPASGLVAPWEVLRGLADVAIERAAKVDSYYYVFYGICCLTIKIRKTATEVNHIVAHGHPLLIDNHDLLNAGKSATSFLAV
jgi:hypothetical protein